MECPACGRYGPPDPTTGYNADELCPECQRFEEERDAKPRDKRVVIQWPDGQMQIVGAVDEQPPALMGSVIPHNLVAVRRSYYLYKPVMIPEQAQSFDVNQQ